MLKDAGIAALACADLAAFAAALGEVTSLAVVTEEAMLGADLRAVAAWLGAQPTWSDLPFIVLTRRGGGLERNPDAARLSEALGNVTFLERPFHPTTFVSMARTAFKGRLRQYEARARIEALHESEQRLRTALLAGRLGAWELDLATWTLACSGASKALFGRRPEQPFSYADMIASLPPDDRERVKAALEASIATGADYAIEHRALQPDGSQRWAEMRARLVYDRRSRNARLVGVSLDITDRKVAEDALRQLNETLEERVAARTAELKRAHESMLAEIEQRERAEEQLRQAQKMEMIGKLTGGVAHDFNNLLMAVLGNLDLLRKLLPPGDAKAQRLIDGALQGAQRGASLTQRLLAFARRQELKLEPRSLAELVRGMTELLERSVGPEIELRFRLPKSLPRALVDANQIELALLNLAVNARDAMPGGGALTIEADLVEAEAGPATAADIAADGVEGGDGLPPGRYLRLAVSDTGHGMDAETLRRATEPFFSTKGPGKGTGLGLSMIHGLAVQLNGALRLTSAPGRGTRAELWLPAATDSAAAAREAKAAREAARQAEKAKATAAEAAEGAEEATPGVTVMIVDDDVLIAMSTAGMLEDLGHQVIEANSGAQALDILRKGRTVDLMITDYSMPQMTGAQLAKAARQLRPGLPILLATGYAELPPGVDIDLPRLAKPYDQAQLSGEIARVLRTKEARAMVK